MELTLENINRILDGQPIETDPYISKTYNFYTVYDNDLCVGCCNCNNCSCCIDCNNCTNCLSCVKCNNLDNKEFCILNKQYTIEEYLKIKKAFGYR